MTKQSPRQSLLEIVESDSELGYAVLLESAKRYLETAPEDEIIDLMKRAVVAANQIRRIEQNKQGTRRLGQNNA